MINVVLLILICCGLFIWLRKKAQSEQRSSGDKNYQALIPVKEESDELSEEELLAIITAIIAEYEGNREFQVVQIQPAPNWRMAGRLEQMRRFR